MSPIYLTRGGNIDAPTGSMRYANFDGYYWSAVAYQVELYAYRLGFGSVSTLPSANGSRLYGFAVWVVVFWFLILNIFEYSIYLTRGGSIYLTIGSLKFAGLAGYYWASEADDSVLQSFRFDFNKTYIYPATDYNRSFGFTVQFVF